MKKKFKKLVLSKSTLSNLNSNKVIGGITQYTDQPYCLASDADMCDSVLKETKCCNSNLPCPSGIISKNKCFNQNSIAC
jgi:hypothetical protein